MLTFVFMLKNIQPEFVEDSFKAAFQRPDKKAASFTQEQFQKIIDALGKKLACALPKESLIKANESAEHQ